MSNPFVTIEYVTADGKRIRIEVSVSVKDLLEQSDRQIRSQRRQDRRHLSTVGFIDGLTDAAMKVPQQTDTADLVVKMESARQLYAAVNELSVKQRRRLLLHFTDGMTHREIADMEGVNRASVSRSIDAALKKLRKELAK